MIIIIMAICKECGINIYWCSVEDDMAALILYGSLTIMCINLWWELLSVYCDHHKKQIFKTNRILVCNE